MADIIEVIDDNVPVEDLIRGLVHDIEAQNLANAGLTPEDIKNGTYFYTCSHCGDRVWAEDGCSCSFN